MTARSTKTVSSPKINNKYSRQQIAVARTSPGRTLVTAINLRVLVIGGRFRQRERGPVAPSKVDGKKTVLDYRLFALDYGLFALDYRLFALDYRLFALDYRLLDESR